MQFRKKQKKAGEKGEAGLKVTSPQMDGVEAFFSLFAFSLKV